MRLTARVTFLEAENRYLRDRAAGITPTVVLAPAPPVDATADRAEAVRLADRLRRAEDHITHIERSCFWRARRVWVALNALVGRRR